MLGASNLSRAFPIALSMAQHVFDGHLDFFIAKGHGRSYGKDSTCLGKKISGIFSCGIWRALEQKKSVPITAFMTDIGNDLAYEVPVETLLGWIETCLDRLIALGARVVLSDLPIDVLRQVGAARYRLFRAILFPQCRLGWRELLGRAELLSERLCELAELREVPMFIGRNDWYDLDPIHPRRGTLSEIWAQQFALVAPTSHQLRRHQCSPALAWYLRGLQPESWSTFGILRRALQPHGRLFDGTTISLY